ncbi:polysaccharide lyase family 8 protein [Mycena filopes]|nr:polysaccharide lyase family 8 protein [Mycena filopes]
MKTVSLFSFFYLAALSAATDPHPRLARRLQARASAVSASASASARPSVSAQPSPPINASTAADIDTLHQRRLTNIVGALTNVSSIPQWLETLNSSGQWPDVDYTAGCTAQRANWPAENHWTRIATLAGAWHGGLPGADPSYVKSASLRASIALAMDWWFANDFTNPDCLDFGGDAQCPCGTPGMWNTNWFPNIIGTPEVVSTSCLLLNDTLSAAELGNCTTMTARAYNTFIVPANGIGVLTGANALDVAKIGIDSALLTVNVTLLTDAYSRVHGQMTVTTGTRADGIRPDGSFGQHSGILLQRELCTNDVVDIEVEAGDAMATLFSGDKWMIYKNVLTGVLHWDFSVLGRFIAFPTADFTQATGSILLNLTKIGDLGNEWNSSTLVDFSTNLSKNVTTANAGNLLGNKMFFDNDYMVQRGSNYVTTLKMFSVRATNSECTNLANPFGFHLADGALRTYVQGDEYEDIAASMDWNRIPGITTDYGATPLTCAQTGALGVEKFVGGVSDGQVGVAAMRYTNPLTKALHWQKAWFFLDNDVQFVMVSNITSASNASVISVLDQKRHNGAVILGGTTRTESSFAQHGLDTQSLWHDNVGYSVANSTSENEFLLSVEVGQKTGNWSAIGTSTQPPTTVDLFSAWITHGSLNASLAYSIFPGVDYDTFVKKSSNSHLTVVQNDATAAALLDDGNAKAMAVVWLAGGATINFAPRSPVQFTIATNDTAAFMFDLKTGVLTVSDPTQALTAVSVTLSVGIARISKTLIFALPTAGGLGGSSVSQNAFHS